MRLPCGAAREMPHGQATVSWTGVHACGSEWCTMLREGGAGTRRVWRAGGRGRVWPVRSTRSGGKRSAFIPCTARDLVQRVGVGLWVCVCCR